MAIINLSMAQLGWLLLLPFLLLACEEIPAADPTATPTAVPILITNTPIPQPTLTPLPDPTATATPDPNQAIDPDSVVGSVERARWLVGEFASQSSDIWQIVADHDYLDIVVIPEAGLDVMVDVRDQWHRSLLPDGPVDNSFGREYVRQAPVPVVGETYLVVTAVGGTTGSYELYVTPAGTVSGPTAGDIAYGELGRGRLETEDSFDLWRFSGQAGDLIDVTIRPLPDELDVVVNIMDPVGRSILPHGIVDQAYGTEYIRGVALPRTGEFLIAIWGFRGTVGPYEVELDLSHAGQPSHARFTSQPLPAQTSTAHPFWAEAGSQISLFVDPDFEFDVVVSLFNEADERLLEVDDFLGLEMLRWTAPATGHYRAEVRGYDADVAGGYGLVLVADPTVRPTLWVGDWVVVDLAAGETAVYTLTPTARQRFHIHTQATDGSDLPFLRLRTPDGNLITEGPAKLTYTPSHDTYLLEVGPVNGRFYLYVDRE